MALLYLFKDSSVVKIFHEDPISSFYAKLLIDRQTDKRRVKHYLLGGGHK